MCLGIPAKIVRINETMAEVDAGGVKRKINIQLLKDVRIGEYVLLHAGFAIQRIDEKEARETLKLLEEINEVCR
ncbi:MAG TPA: HypC/HybG/HupF family hydrogenase formation chaperone [bacterium]|nr:HypC/HybG/HupF family hydrogenase formation chaperone [bacterium]